MRGLGLAIPLYQEEETCRATLTALHGALEQVGAPFTLVAVDNGCTDGTGPLLDGLAGTLPHLQVLHLPRNQGYGGGIRAGLDRLDTPLVGWHWGDGQVEPGVVVAAWRTLEGGAWDGVVTRRTRREDGVGRWVQSRTYHLAARGLLGLGNPDLHGCPKIFTREALARLDLRSGDWLLDLEAHWKARNLGLALGQVSATMGPRVGGRSKVRWHTALLFSRALVDLRRGRLPWERDTTLEGGA